jgi:RNA polymerase sigma-70 factor (ECF subfamily)
VTDQDQEHEWLQRARRGDPDAVGELYRRYARAVYRYAFYRLGDPERAEDVTADVFVRALEALPRFRERGVPFSAWLYRIAAARVADEFRRRRRRPTQSVPWELVEGSPSPEEKAEERFTAEQLRRLVGQLPEIQQQVVVLRFVERLSHAEVARILRRSEGAVRVLQYRALQTLKRMLTQEQGADGSDTD